jgi:hypothetical protein
MLKIAMSHTYKDYQCSVLNKPTDVDYMHITNAGPVVTPQTAHPDIPFNVTVATMFCHNRDECGISYSSNDGKLDYNWGRCPAHRTFAEGRSLISIQGVKS